jgi:hypothetical protein
LNATEQCRQRADHQTPAVRDQFIWADRDDTKTTRNAALSAVRDNFIFSSFCKAASRRVYSTGKPQVLCPQSATGNSRSASPHVKRQRLRVRADIKEQMSKSKEQKTSLTFALCFLLFALCSSLSAL